MWSEKCIERYGPIVRKIKEEGGGKRRKESRKKEEKEEKVDTENWREN